MAPLEAILGSCGRRELAATSGLCADVFDEEEAGHLEEVLARHGVRLHGLEYLSKKPANAKVPLTVPMQGT